MKVNFEFNNQFVPMSFVDIDEIGEFALQAYNDEGFFWHMVVQTCLGQTMIAVSGPVIPDFDELTKFGYSVNIFTLEYDEHKIEKYINSWLNDKNKKLTGAEVISMKDALYQFKDAKEYVERFKRDIL